MAFVLQACWSRSANVMSGLWSGLCDRLLLQLFEEIDYNELGLDEITTDHTYSVKSVNIEVSWPKCRLGTLH